MSLTMSKSPKPLANTSYAVLGLLSFGDELSGYEIRKEAAALKFFYWSPAQSQIYSELRRLEGFSYVTSRKVEQDSKPNKQLYKITDAGSQALRTWLSTEPIENTVMKHSMLFKLFFAHMTSPAILAEHLQDFISQSKEQLGQLAVVQEFAELDDKNPYQAHVLDWGQQHYEAEIASAEKLLEHLKNNLKNST